MAVTSIWAVHSSVKDVLDYAANPKKTENPNADDLKKLMDKGVISIAGVRNGCCYKYELIQD